MKNSRSSGQGPQKKLTQEQHRNRLSKGSSKVITKNTIKSGHNYALAQIFPFQFEQDELAIDFTKEEKRFFIKGNSETFFEAKYKSFPVILSCMYQTPNKKINDLRNTIFNYELKMSNELSACRGINPYITSFKGSLKELKPAFYIIKSFSDNISLKDYIENYESQYEKGREPIPMIIFLQMAISLFAMLRDAHLKKIGLVNINTETVKVSIDQTLYFDDFKSCLELGVKTAIKAKPWINLKKLPCPEWENFETSYYHESADVFSAATVLAQLIRIPSSNNLPPFQRIPNKGIITVVNNRIREPFKYFSQILNACLDMNPKKRPTAAELLTLFEDLRAKAFFKKTIP